MISHLLPGFVPRLFRRVSEHLYWTRTLPRTTEATIDGIHFDLTRMTVLMRNRLLKGGHERNEAALCREFLKPRDAVLELGAGIGFIGLICQKHIGVRQHVMVEANPATLAILERNFTINGLHPNAWNLAVSNDEHAVDLDVSGEFVTNSITGVSQDPGASRVRVPSASLPCLLDRLPETNALVIDIEGAERGIDFGRLPERIDKVILELHPALIGYAATFEIVATLVGAGFSVAKVLDFDYQSGCFAFLRSNAGGPA